MVCIRKVFANAMNKASYCQDQLENLFCNLNYSVATCLKSTYLFPILILCVTDSLTQSEFALFILTKYASIVICYSA